MARKKRPESEATVPEPISPVRSGEPINVWVRKPIMKALRKYIASTKPRVTKTATVEEALEEFLAAKGFPVEADD